MSSNDPALPAVLAVVQAVEDLFTPTPVRLLAGDGTPVALWEAHVNEKGCDEPFIWVRAMQRYRSREFPDPTLQVDSCGLPRVIAIEIGVGRCAEINQSATWDDYHDEALTTLHDSFLLETAMCRVADKLSDLAYAVGSDTIAPYGPEGGVIAWTGVTFVQFD